MAVSKRLRFEILRRDNHACRYCGAKAPDVELVVDHVVPITLGGTNDPENLTAACQPCNNGKGSVPAGAPLVADVAMDSLRWSRAMRSAIAEARERRAEVAEVVDLVGQAWNRFGYGPDDDRRNVPLPADWYMSVEQIWTCGMQDVDFLIRAVDRAMAKQGIPHADRWKYWCGCCWGHLREIQARAAILAHGEQ